MSDEHKPSTIELVIVYGTNKKIKASDPETIEQVKEGAFGLFGIDLSEFGRFVLRAKIKGEKDVQLDEANTVEFYELHDGQKVTLASGTPFGANPTVEVTCVGEQTAEPATPEEEAKALAAREYEPAACAEQHLRLADATGGRRGLSGYLRADREVAGARVRAEARVRRLRRAGAAAGVHRP